MSAIDEQTVRRIAKLARIRLKPEEVASYAKELTSIMAMVEQLSEVVDDSEAVASVVDHPLPMREDVIHHDAQMVEQVLANAPKSAYGCFVVPKVIDQG
ncbi:MAG: Asp-tRNA(Asn)/Glu-tRNA(Gln) amidotransferase subunit GatC [Alphaproteobacteria bacterium]|nr:MAG: Asp-tRNA(Asn)/Glu-tRNA(Gln) amidotransferase subunit GatC [Alphaproteobacteria bacterium]TAF14802.1 MAG: Asp-tRNA(Asn)/Glu-tRNA(Gln) amidotransferase subunit GatC [Alphaproteobacteria bacterium]TAF40551.1 MAG: Asp-tRNA(Asn)/Glu-tRNA(Gln) amidotransferase subunit GatC [Alphaproteobacteria bacterium]